MPICAMFLVLLTGACFRTSRPDPMDFRYKRYKIGSYQNNESATTESPGSSPVGRSAPPVEDLKKQNNTAPRPATTTDEPATPPGNQKPGPHTVSPVQPPPQIKLPSKIVPVYLPGWNSNSPGKLKSMPKQDNENKLPFKITNIGIASAESLVLKGIDSHDKEKKKWMVTVYNTQSRRVSDYHVGDIIKFNNRFNQPVALRIYYLEKRLLYLENVNSKMLSPGIIRIGERLKYANCLNIVYKNRHIQLVENTPIPVAEHTYTYAGFRSSNKLYYALLVEDDKILYKIYMPY